MTTEPTSTETVFTPTPVVPVPRPKRSSRLLDLALGAAAVLAIAGVAFAVGRTTAPATTVPAAAFQQGTFVRPNGSFAPGAGGPGSAFALGGRLAIDGTVTAVTADSMTIKTANGREVTVSLDGSTAYHQATSAAASDVAVGAAVTVRVDGGLRGNGNGNGGNGNGNGGQGGNGQTGTGATPQLTASDVTVAR